MRSVTAATRAGALIGRGSELARLAGLIRAAATGRGSAVLIEGEPGIGKSSLVRAALAEAADARCPVFWGAGDELGQALPLLPLLEALRVRVLPDSPRRSTIVRMLRGELAAGPGADVSAAVAEQLLALIAEQCAAQPAILVVDDLQWADQASVTLWARLARSVDQMPLLLAGMMRPVPQRKDLLALRRAVGEGAWLQLTRLTDEAVAELVTALVGGRPGDDLLQLAGGAAGQSAVCDGTGRRARAQRQADRHGHRHHRAGQRPLTSIASGGHRRPPGLRLRADAGGAAGGRLAGRGLRSGGPDDRARPPHRGLDAGH